MNLQKEILQRLENDDLLELFKTYPSLRTDKELARRLTDCKINNSNNSNNLNNSKDLHDLLNIIEKIEKTPDIVIALQEYRKCIPWRIGIIYDYTNAKIKKIEVSVGFKGRYQIDGKKILFTWLDSNFNRLMLREISNIPGFNINISMQLQELESLKVLDILLNSYETGKKFTLMYGVYSGKNSYGNPLQHSENYEVVPLSILNFNNKWLDFFKYKNIEPQYEQVKVDLSPEAIQYLKIIRK